MLFFNIFLVKIITPMSFILTLHFKSINRLSTNLISYLITPRILALQNQAPSSLPVAPLPNQSFLYPSVEQTYSETPKLTKDAVISPVDLFHHTDQIIQQNLSPSHGDIPMIRKFLLRKC